MTNKSESHYSKSKKIALLVGVIAILLFDLFVNYPDLLAHHQKNIQTRGTEIFHDPNYVAINHFDEIVLHRRRGFWGGPVYKIIIFGDGNVIYMGEEAVKTIGPAAATLSQQDIASLIAAINTVEYSSISKNDWDEPCRTDFDSADTEVKINGKQYQIRHYEGTCTGGSLQLKKFEDDIDKIANSIQWIGPLERQ